MATSLMLARITVVLYDFMQWDITAKYEVNDKFTIRAEAVNLNNRPEYYYWGNTGQLSQYDMYGRNYSIGFNYTL